MPKVSLPVLVAISLILTLALASPSLAQDQQRFRTEKEEIVVETVARDLQNPWGLAFLPDGRMLVTERPGRLRIVNPDGQISRPIAGLPPITARGQGGLLDVALDPGFAQNRRIYLSFTENRGQSRVGTSVVRAQLASDDSALQASEIIFRQQPSYPGRHHFGSRLVFDRQGHLFVTLGDRFDLRTEAQNPGNHIGKIVRITSDGRPPPSNPFLSREGSRPEIWSLGHRNIQAAALHPTTGELWTVEHGARGGDELNIPRAGRNYGWPVISYGVDYSGARIGEGTAKPGLEQPVFYWDPSIAPSGMTFYTGDQFPGWRGSILVGALAGRHVARLEASGDRVTHHERILQGLNHRIRDVRQGPDGFLYLLTDSSEGRILRVRPAR